MAEPSNPIPSENAAYNSAGATATDFNEPITSVNQSLTNRMSRSSIVLNTKSDCLSMPSIVPHDCFLNVTKNM